ncbi:sensor histidine kinase [Beijerinckia mobilis]|uniref:sensor histidine kinase n=1 Tax=Beijerinckia mobilis TaxID=231434 RepID=UPI000559410E|nr:PAS domain-containing sensor histidine kinase [Beijerinckia mobilis]
MTGTDKVLDFHALFENLPVPLLVLARDQTIAALNAAYRRAARIGIDVVGQAFDAVFPLDEATRTLIAESCARVLNQGVSDVTSLLTVPIRVDDVLTPRYWCYTHSPLRDQEGEITFILQNAQDMTEAVTAQFPMEPAGSRQGEFIGDPQEETGLDNCVDIVNESLLEETLHLRRLLMQAPSFMAVLRGPDYRLELTNLAFLKLAGGRDLAGKPFAEAVPEIGSQDYLRILDHVYKTGKAFLGRRMKAALQDEPEAALSDHYLDFVLQPIMGQNGEVNGIFVVGNDVTDQVLAEEHQALLIRELHHRVRNTLAVVQGVMTSTAKNSPSIEDFQSAFAGRIASLAKTHAAMTEELQQSVEFRQLLVQELAPYGLDRDGRITLIGPTVDLPSQIGVPLGMAIHELATNAAKHGALADANGRLKVIWSLVEKNGGNALCCDWEESDGPRVSLPLSQGFGSMLLQRVLSQQIHAEVTADYDPKGFKLHLVIPMAKES